MGENCLKTGLRLKFGVNESAIIKKIMKHKSVDVDIAYMVQQGASLSQTFSPLIFAASTTKTKPEFCPYGWFHEGGIQHISTYPSFSATSERQENNGRFGR